MLEETGTVVKIEPDALWVETVQTTTCGSCSARRGCGQRDFVITRRYTGARNVQDQTEIA